MFALSDFSWGRCGVIICPALLKPMQYNNISGITSIFKILNIRYSNSQISEISKLLILSVVCYTIFAYSTLFVEKNVS